MIDRIKRKTDEEQVAAPTPDEELSVRQAALGKLKDSLLGSVTPPKAEDPLFKLKRLQRMGAGVQSPLQLLMNKGA